MYLAIPLIAAVLDMFWGMFLFHHHQVTTAESHIPAAQEIPATAEAVELPDLCIGDEAVCNAAAVSDAGESWKKVENDDDEEEDPMLMQMPDVDFKAYVRKDISSMYDEEPGSRVEKTPRFNGQAAKMVNMSPDRLSLYWDDRRGDYRFIGYAGPWHAAGTASFEGHVFLMSPHGKPSEGYVCNVVKETATYFVDPYSEDQGEPGRCRKPGSSEVRSLDELSQEDREKYNRHHFNLEFGKKYKEFTGGAEWLSMYPRDPPRHKIWRADYFGQEHQVKTAETHFLEYPPGEKLGKLSMETLRRNSTDPVALAEYRSSETMTLTLKAVSVEPRAFEIINFLSDVEVQHMLDLAAGKDLKHSTTGSNSDEASDSDTRTSTNTWVSRYSSPIVDAIYRRAADALRLDEALLRHRQADEHPELGSKQPLSEDLQLVHYDVGEQYTAHHDFGYTDLKADNAPSRSINIILYLNEGMEGGETSFPRWRNAETSGGLDVKPLKGKAAIFYMVLPDGNKDDLTQHAALPIVKGEKFMTNLWIWDPIKL
jgi:prolyl 4-hydroxylase